MNEVKTPRRVEDGREGFALVTTLLIVLVLSVLALGVAWLASSEKKTTFAEGVHIRSVLAADAGTEAGINFIRVADSPPTINDFGTMVVLDQAETVLQGSQAYAVRCNFDQRRPKIGWGVGYYDFDYEIDSEGKASAKGETDVRVLVSRLFKEGY